MIRRTSAVQQAAGTKGSNIECCSQQHLCSMLLHLANTTHQSVPAWRASQLKGVHDGELAHRIPGSWVDLPAWRTLPLACIQSSVVYQTLHASLWVWCVTRHGVLGAL